MYESLITIKFLGAETRGGGGGGGGTETRGVRGFDSKISTLYDTAYLLDIIAIILLEIRA